MKLNKDTKVRFYVEGCVDQDEIETLEELGINPNGEMLKHRLEDAMLAFLLTHVECGWEFVKEEMSYDQ